MRIASNQAPLRARPECHHTRARAHAHTHDVLAQLAAAEDYNSISKVRGRRHFSCIEDDRKHDVKATHQ